MTTILPPVLARIDALGLRVFRDGDYNLNLFGIRSSDLSAGTFNDLLGCAYKTSGQWQVMYWAATTDPGVYYREHPENVEGTAILCPGQYRGVYAIDKHGGKYEALCQRNGTVQVWRDDNRDTVLDVDPETPTESGYFGINIHASSNDPYGEVRDRSADAPVNRWSAGCQVHATTTGFRQMMELVHKQIEAHPTWAQKYTYTLLDQWW